jgi:3'-5' exoribonuclease
MKYIETLREGERIGEVYLVKSKVNAMTKSGKPYESILLQDKTGTLDAKIWDPGSNGIDDYEALDYVDVVGDVISFQGSLQLNVKRLRRVGEGEYDPSDYLPVSSRDIDEMYEKLLGYIDTIKNPHYHRLASFYFAENEAFRKQFCFHSAAKSVHHGFVGGLLEHTLSVTEICAFFAEKYEVLNRDLLLTAAIFHDVGKLMELSAFPENDYTDDGQLLGHIMIGAQMVSDRLRTFGNVPHKQISELVHCILAHHGELEYGSPKKPALAEAVALSYADNVDAKMETVKELLGSTPQGNTQWLGYNRLLESNFRRTSES